MRVLVVDDSPDMLTLLRLALQLDGYAVDTAATGALALDQYLNGNCTYGEQYVLNHDTIRQLVVRLLGVEPDTIAPTGSPVALFLNIAGRRLVAKLPAPNHPGSALVEAWAYQECRRRGIHTPEVVATSDEPECIIVVALAGHSLWSQGHQKEQERDVWHKLGEDLRAMHEIRLPGFGPLVLDADGIPHGEAKRWCPFIRFAREEGIEHLQRRGYISTTTARRLTHRYGDAASLLNTWTDGHLLHGDLEGGHVFVTDDGAYSGLIDFGLAQSGDPRWDLARVLLWDGPAALDALLDGYGRDVMTAENRVVVLPLYLLAFVIHQAVQLDRVGRQDAALAHLQQVGYDEALIG